MKLPAQQPTVFQDKPLPPRTALAGTSALVHAFDVQAPVRHPVCISSQHIKGHVKEQGGWRVYEKRYEVEPTVVEHLNFAMRYEPVDLLVLKRIFLSLPPEELQAYVQSAPTSVFARRAWYLYELLTGKQLSVPDAPNVTAVELLDPRHYFTRPTGTLSRRHKVRDNLLGTSRFCPIIRRTEALTGFVGRNLAESARQVIGTVSKAVIARAASFLLLADSKASFEIEGERPPRDRIQRWGRAVMQAGRNPLSADELIRLHGVLIEDNRFVRPGFRTEGVFLGERTTDGEPLPEFIGARPEDLLELIYALVETNALMRDASLDAVLQAAVTAFGFVYIHPFEDGNGRLHRYLIHHVLADRQFTPSGMVFPVSSVMLDWIDDYRQTLQAHSAPLMDFIDWIPTERGNVSVRNDTADLYRFWDCTEAAEFLYRCVERTIEVDLPREIDFLMRRDEAMRNVMNTVEMPDRLAEQFILYVQQNNGKLPKRRRNEFAPLTDDELDRLEHIVAHAFEGFE
ncbi:MAG TPA: Fic family protein [Candidatus Obscuribacterales bacterium]